MAGRGEIKSEKIWVKNIFSDMWFRIPEYQRPYVWGTDQVSELLDDLKFAMTEKPNLDYFLGSIVFQSKAVALGNGQKFFENDLLDGQQRMTTLLLLFATIRDITKYDKAKKNCQGCIHQEEDEYKGIPERTRILFAIREETQEFIEDYIVKDSGTIEIEKQILELSKKENISIQNMTKAVVVMRNFFYKNPDIEPGDFLRFLLINVLMIYVSTEDLEDAFRLFTILNDRGVPLRNSDILKSMNLGELNTQEEKIRYAKMWEEAEGELGDDFDRFLNHVRTILVKDKSRLSLLKEFEEKIYTPGILDKGEDTFKLIGRYLNHYRMLFDGQSYEKGSKVEFDNLLKVMLNGLPATDWMPPLLRYFDKFHYQHILDFLKRLDNKFSADWIGQYSPTDRIEAMNRIIQVIDDAENVEQVFKSKYFDIDAKSLKRVIEGPVYGRRFARYLLLKLDYLWKDHYQHMNFETLSVEHILPQNPEENSNWVKEDLGFTPEEREEWTDKLGNLVLITRRKNSELGRLDYQMKKDEYFRKNIGTCPNSLRILNEYENWTAKELEENHRIVLNKVYAHYGIPRALWYPDP